MKTTLNAVLAGALLAGAISGCATVAPPQLVDARNAYSASNAGLASRMAPTELYEAKKVLDKANAEFSEHGDTLEVRDYAYIAKRKIELAEAKARTEIDRQSIAEAAKMGVAVRDEQVRQTKAELSATREQLSQERTASTQNARELEKTAAELEAEKQARQAAEDKLAGAMKDLATVAAVKEEARGVVITLSGSVLFASGKDTLLETAKVKLDQVAETLKDDMSDQKMVVEGHTDSQGSDAVNEPLSRARAAAVREYLVQRGVDANKITSVGMGSRRPLVDNATAENRANNRRVEIVVQPSRLSTR
ncbi:MAG: OmpA family protein [Archangium sp.]|nr:OmpA family protein [Archangium sp.]